jgi:plastocyanin
VALLLIFVAVVVQVTQEATIPPLIVLAVVLAVGAALLVVRPRVGAIVVGAAAVLMVVGNVTHLAGDLAHPESFWSFLPAALSVMGAVVGAYGLVAVLRRHGPEGAKVAAALGAAAVVVLVGFAGVQTGAEPDDQPAEGDIGMWAQDIEFKPSRLEAPAGEFGIFIANDDLVRHNLTIEDLDVDAELPSKAFVRVPVDAEPGTYEFFCDIPGHDDMTGTLEVTAS